MSELVNTLNTRATIKRNLLATVSALAITGYVAATDVAFADNTDHPTVWVELGGQLDRATGGDHTYSPSLFGLLDPSITSPAKIADGLPLGFGPEGKISFQPEGSNWVFSASVRYGRSFSHRTTNQQKTGGEFTDTFRIFTHYYTAGGAYHYGFKCCQTHKTRPHGDYADVQSRHQEDHFVLDFQAGKDVGLGLFGRQGTSVMSAGVRFAQFVTKSELMVKAKGGTLYYNGYLANSYYAHALSQFPQIYRLATRFRVLSLDAGSSRSFSGVGPSISWDASTALLGQSDSSELTFDWGVNAAVLFGKQKAQTNHQSSGFYKKGYHHLSAYNNPRVDFTRSRNVIVPNAGGMAGFSIRFPNAKVSIGYRADIFFGAMDAGWDVRETKSRSFRGPFASVSIGLGG